MAEIWYARELSKRWAYRKWNRWWMHLQCCIVWNESVFSILIWFYKQEHLQDSKDKRLASLLTVCMHRAVPSSSSCHHLLHGYVYHHPCPTRTSYQLVLPFPGAFPVLFTYICVYFLSHQWLPTDSQAKIMERNSQWQQNMTLSCSLFTPLSILTVVGEPNRTWMLYYCFPCLLSKKLPLLWHMLFGLSSHFPIGKKNSR